LDGFAFLVFLSFFRAFYLSVFLSLFFPAIVRLLMRYRLTPWQEQADSLVVIACGGDGTVVRFIALH
jgi:hypothetical protein